MTDSQIANDNGSISTAPVAVESKQQLPPVKKSKPHRVLMTFSQWGEQAKIGVLDIEATGVREAKARLADLLRRLDLDQIDAITVDAHELGYDFSDPEIIAVWKMRSDDLGHVWTREQIESEHLDAIVRSVADKIQGGVEEVLVMEASPVKGEPPSATHGSASAVADTKTASRTTVGEQPNRRTPAVCANGRRTKSNEPKQQ